MSRYVILDDGQFRWPANAAAVADYDGDPMSDDGCATAGAIPAELREECGAVGSAECAAVCDRLYKAGAEIIRA